MMSDDEYFDYKPKILTRWRDERISLLREALWCHDCRWWAGADKTIKELADLVVKEHEECSTVKSHLQCDKGKEHEILRAYEGESNDTASKE